MEFLFYLWKTCKYLRKIVSEADHYTLYIQKAKKCDVIKGNADQKMYVCSERLNKIVIWRKMFF